MIFLPHTLLGFLSRNLGCYSSSTYGPTLNRHFIIYLFIYLFAHKSTIIIAIKYVRQGHHGHSNVSAIAAVTLTYLFIYLGRTAAARMQVGLRSRS